MSGTTVGGGLAPFNFTSVNSDFDGYAQAAFSGFFGTGSSIGDGSALYTGGSAPVPDPSTSTNGTLAILGAGNVTLPGGYSAVYDLAGGDTVTGSGDQTVFLQGGVSSGTWFNTGSGNDLIYAGGADTITAGAGSNTVVAGSGDVTVDGTAGTNLYFVGGSGAVSVTGGSGDSVLFGGSGSSTTFLQGGSGNNTLVGGSGTGASTIGGGNNLVAFANGTGPTTLLAGTGSSILNGTTGTGLELFSTNPLGNTGTAVIALNDAADTVVGGSGASTVWGGGGTDTYAFLAGHAGGSETIYNLKQGDLIAFGGYDSNPIASEDASSGSDIITLTDGTQITLAGIDHKLFS